MEPAIINKQTGVVEYPHLHDSIITELHFSREWISIRFKTIRPESILLILEGIVGFEGNEFFVENIVFEIIITSAEALSLEHLGRLLSFSIDERNFEKVGRFKNDQYVFVHIIPTLGAEIQVLCRKANWEKVL